MMDIKKHSKQKMDQIDIIFHCFNFTVSSNVCLAYQFVSNKKKKKTEKNINMYQFTSQYGCKSISYLTWKHNQSSIPIKWNNNVKKRNYMSSTIHLYHEVNRTQCSNRQKTLFKNNFNENIRKSISSS